MDGRFANRAILYQTPNSRNVHELRLSRRGFVRVRGGRADLFWEAFKRFDSGRSRTARGGSEIARIFADTQYGKSARTAQYRARPDGEIFSAEIFAGAG